MVGLTRQRGFLRNLVSGFAIDGWSHTPQRGFLRRMVPGFATDGVGLTRYNEGSAQNGPWHRH